MASEAVFLIENGGIIDCNPEAERMFARPREQLVSKMPHDFSPESQPDGRKSMELARERIEMATAGIPQSFEWQHMKSDGTVFDAEENMSGLDVEGKHILLVVVRDIADRKRDDEATRETEQMFRAIVENSHAGIFTIDDAFRIIYANNMTEKLLLRTNDEIIGHDFREMLDEESKRIVADRYMRRQLGEDIPTRYEFTVVQKNGDKRQVEISSTIFRTTSGSLRTVGQVLDITEHKKADEELRLAHEELESRVEARTAELTDTNAHLERAIAQRVQAEEALRQSELKYRRLVQSANTIILEIDVEGRITFFNSFAEKFFGFAESEILGKSIIGTIVPGGVDSERNFSNLIDDLIKHPDHYTQNEYEYVKKNGERVWIFWTNQPFFDEQGGLQRILRVGIDRTEQKRSEEMLARQAREQAAAAERNRLARDLHDAVSQTLFSASLIADVLPHLWDSDQAEGRKRLEEVKQLTRGALAEMRTLLVELRPAALVEAELGHLLGQLGESITGRSRVPVTVTVHCEYSPPPEVKVALYRIAQESLNNVAKYSAATEAEVVLTCNKKRITLSVSDNGQGFNVKAVHPDSLGLGIMRERARQIGARLSIRSHPGSGTCVRAVWTNYSGEANP